MDWLVGRLIGEVNMLLSWLYGRVMEKREGEGEERDEVREGGS